MENIKPIDPASASPSGNPGTNEKIDYREYLAAASTLWDEYASSLDIPEDASDTNLLKILLKNTVRLKDEQFYLLSLGFFLILSACSQTAPVLIVHGPSGSGKSRLLQFGAALYDTNILSSASTVVSIRNQIENGRFSEGGFERNYCLFVDDIKD